MKKNRVRILSRHCVGQLQSLVLSGAIPKLTLNRARRQQRKNVLHRSFHRIRTFDLGNLRDLEVVEMAARPRNSEELICVSLAAKP